MSANQRVTIALACLALTTGGAKAGDAGSSDGANSLGEPASFAAQSASAAQEDSAAFVELFEELRSGDYRAALNALETSFPEDFTALKEEMRAAFVEGGPSRQIVWSRTTMGRVVAREMGAVVRAPDDYLIDYLIANRDGYAVAARRMPEICNQIASGVFNFNSPLDPELVRAMSRTTASLLHASAASRVRSVDRNVGPPTEAELETLVGALLALGMTTEDAGLIDDPAAMAIADPVRTCRVRQLLLDGALQMPPPVAARFAAGMISTTVQGRRP